MTPESLQPATRCVRRRILPRYPAAHSSTSDAAAGCFPLPHDSLGAQVRAFRFDPDSAMDETSRLVTPGELVSVSIYHDQGLSRRPDGRRNAVIAAQAHRSFNTHRRGSSLPCCLRTPLPAIWRETSVGKLLRAKFWPSTTQARHLTQT